MADQNINMLVNDFVKNLTELIQQQAEGRAREAVESAFGSPRAKRGPNKVGRPPALSSKKADPRRQLQGRYIGMLRRFSGKEKEEVRAIYSSKGIEAAIKKLETMQARAN